jgi:two-component SAPR family response regulator
VRAVSKTKADACLNIHASADALPRALRIFDAIIKKWEELGGGVRIDQQSNQGYSTRFTFGEDSVAVAICEEMDRVEKAPAKNKYYQEWDYKPNGRLVLSISGRWADNLRSRWADGKKQRLENVLGSFIEGLQKWIAHEHDRRLDDQCEERQRKKVAEVRQKREELVKEMEQRREQLEQCASNFARSEEIRRYLATFESKIAAG